MAREKVSKFFKLNLVLQVLQQNLSVKEVASSNSINKMKKYKSQYTKTTFYQLEIWKTFGVNLFYCFNCNTKMRVKEYHISISLLTPFAGRNTVGNADVKSAFFFYSKLYLLFF